MTQGFSIEFLIYINIVLVYHYKRAYHGEFITRKHCLIITLRNSGYVV